MRPVAKRAFAVAKPHLKAAAKNLVSEAARGIGKRVFKGRETKQQSGRGRRTTRKRGTGAKAQRRKSKRTRVKAKRTTKRKRPRRKGKASKAKRSKIDLIPNIF